MPEVTLDENDKAAARDSHGREILTLGQLRELTAHLPDDTHVVLATDGWYDNVKSVAIPVASTDPAMHGCNRLWEAVTLFPGDEMDARQF